MQAQGVVGRAVAAMIRRTVRARFRSVWWKPSEAEGLPEAPMIFVANHHGWHDGYLMFHLVERLGVRSLDWIQEFDAFPLFRHIGGMPFPADRPELRSTTVRKTIRSMKEDRRSLVLFAEGVLHPAPGLLPFGRALETVTRAVPECSVIPVGIRYSMGIHERPEAVMRLGTRVELGDGLLERAEAAVDNLLSGPYPDVNSGGWEELVKGTRDVNERWDMRRARR